MGLTQKPSGLTSPKRKAKLHRGDHRELRSNPTRTCDVLATACQDCGSDVSGVAQNPCESYKSIEFPKIEPVINRVSLCGGVCPCCAKRFKDEAPERLEPGRPFGSNLRALVIALRSIQNIPLARVAAVLKELVGLYVSEGALVGILWACRKPCESLYSDTSRPFFRPKFGRIVVKVVNHLGDEVIKVFAVAP